MEIFFFFIIYRRTRSPGGSGSPTAINQSRVIYAELFVSLSVFFIDASGVPGQARINFERSLCSTDFFTLLFLFEKNLVQKILSRIIFFFLLFFSTRLGVERDLCMGALASRAACLFFVFSMESRIDWGLKKKCALSISIPEIAFKRRGKLIILTTKY